MAQNATGSKIEFLTSLVVLDVTGLSVDGVSRPVLDTTHHLTTGGRTSIPGDIVEWGTIKVECHYNPDVYTLIQADPESIRMTDGEGEVTTGTGFVSDASAAYPLEGVQTMSVTIKRAAAPVIS